MHKILASGCIPSWKSISPTVSLLQLLDVYFHRANEAQLSSFLRMQGFHQLANQLHQYPATQELAEACLTITFGKPVDLNEE